MCAASGAVVPALASAHTYQYSSLSSLSSGKLSSSSGGSSSYHSHIVRPIRDAPLHCLLCSMSPHALQRWHVRALRLRPSLPRLRTIGSSPASAIASAGVGPICAPPTTCGLPSTTAATATARTGGLGSTCSRHTTGRVVAHLWPQRVWPRRAGPQWGVCVVNWAAPAASVQQA